MQDSPLGISGRSAETVRVLEKNDSAPVVHERIVRNGDRVVACADSGIAAALGDVDRAGRKTRVRGSVYKRIANEGILLDLRVVGDLHDDTVAGVILDVIIFEVEVVIVGVGP